MSKVYLMTALFIPVAIGLVTAGCSKQQASQQQPATSPDMSQMQPTATGHEGHKPGQAGDTEPAPTGMQTRLATLLHNSRRRIVPSQTNKRRVQ